MFDASLMPEDFRPSAVFDKEVLLNYAEASRYEAPVKKYLPVCNAAKARRRLMRKQAGAAREATGSQGPRSGKRNGRPPMGRMH